MIVYSEVVEKFLTDVNNNIISQTLNNKLKEKLYKYSSKSEMDSWDASLKFMAEILSKSNVPSDCTVILEYNLPMTSKRIDFILSGYNESNKPILLLFELKQWSDIYSTDNNEDLLETFIGGGIKKVVHPAYQVWSYEELLKDFNKYIQDNNITIKSSAILHNYLIKGNDPLFDSKFNDILCKVNVFTKDNFDDLIQYLNENLKYGDNKKLIYKVDNSKVVPSKSLQKDVDLMLNNNSSLNLIDDQKIIFEEILSLSQKGQKQVIIVDGNPGTGKSVLAINLLAKQIMNGKMCQYVSRNTAPRVVYSYKLKRTMKKSSIDNLFKTSSNYTTIENDNFDMLLVDEAHCLTEKSGLFNNYGENQIKELVGSAKCSIFFIDELQRVHLNDIGTKNEIKRWANYYNADIKEFSLCSQFRCCGSDSYLDFVNYILDINNIFSGIKLDYDINVVESPFELEKIIKKKNETSFSRVLAGYCWNWNKKEADNPAYCDIKIGEYEASWNLGQKQTFVIDDSINEVGCIHSVQGLEFDYVGVIIGEDMRYENGKIITDFTRHASTDPSFKGIKKMYKENRNKALSVADEIIKNTYRVLLTRGINGCFIYCVDEALNKHLKQVIKEYKINK